MSESIPLTFDPDSPLPPTPETRPRPARKIPWNWILLPLLLLAGLAAAWYAWRLWNGWAAGAALRPKTVPPAGFVWEIAFLGITAAILLACVITLLNGIRANKRWCKWYFRIPISLLKRALLLVQIGGTGLALYALGVLYLGVKIYPL